TTSTATTTPITTTATPSNHPSSSATTTTTAKTSNNSFATCNTAIANINPPSLFNIATTTTTTTTTANPIPSSPGFQTPLDMLVAAANEVLSNSSSPVMTDSMDLGADDKTTTVNYLHRHDANSSSFAATVADAEARECRLSQLERTDKRQTTVTRSLQRSAKSHEDQLSANKEARIKIYDDRKILNKAIEKIKSALRPLCDDKFIMRALRNTNELGNLQKDNVDDDNVVSFETKIVTKITTTTTKNNKRKHTDQDANDEEPITIITKYNTDNTNYVRGVHIFGILSSLVTLILLSIAADANKSLYNKGIHYDGTSIVAGTDTMLPNWILLGIVVSAIGLVIPTAALVLFTVNKKIKYPLIEAIIFSLLSVASLVYVIAGAINTDIVDCFTWDGEQRLRCSTPKGAEFFAFIGLMTFIFAVSNGVKEWWKNKHPEPFNNNNNEINEVVNTEVA
ncbi:4927_t:CDS:2, partial [Entrophospora sp. SA101]